MAYGQNAPSCDPLIDCWIAAVNDHDNSSSTQIVQCHQNTVSPGSVWYNHAVQFRARSVRWADTLNIFVVHRKHHLFFLFVCFLFVFVFVFVIAKVGLSVTLILITIQLKINPVVFQALAQNNVLWSRGKNLNHIGISLFFFSNITLAM